MSELDEAAEKRIPTSTKVWDLTETRRSDFIAGANYQAERMFSEKEVNEIISAVWLSCEDNEGETFSNAKQRILKQFKKK